MKTDLFTFSTATPILRIFDEAKAREFYLDYLGAEITFEHRFYDGAPLYMGIKLGEVQIHLSEHVGDCSPAARIRIEAKNLEAFSDWLRAKSYKYFNPGKPAKMDWGEWDLTLTDPFANKLTFFERDA